MAAITGIGWTDSTANLWIGCTKVSAGCDHCYAEAEQDHRRHRVTWGPHGDRSYCKAGWALIRQMQKRAAKNGGVDPDLGRRRRIFVNSLSDVMDNHRSIDPWRGDAFALMEESTAVDLILVTKRPQNVERYVPPHWLERWPQHVWLLTTTENQEEFDRRVPILMWLKATANVGVVGVSAEPLLEMIDPARGMFTADIAAGILASGRFSPGMEKLRCLDWWIAGGESGGQASREMDLDWPRAHRTICAASGTAFFFKQTRNKGPIPGDLMVREFPR